VSQAAAAPGSAQRARPRIWQLALVLNVFLPPAGYAYVGAWRTAGVFAVCVIAAVIGLTEGTIAFPPGLYVQGVAGVVVLALCLAVALGVHAAWMAEDAAPKAGSRVRSAAIYGLTSLAVLTSVQVLRAYWPHAFYTMETSGMAPTLNRGDLVAVRGRLGACEGPAPEPGDVALYRRGEYLYLHRVVAGPGQTVAMRGGQLSVDGRPVGRHGVDQVEVEFSEQPTLVVEETLANGRRFMTYDAERDGVFDELAPTRVPADRWFVMGDDRDNSFDSRARGAIERRNICGVAFRIITNQDKRRVGQEP
jgi:signal peptidase I